MTRSKRMALAILAVGLAACGGDGGGGVAKEDFGARVQEALCERYARCGVYPSAEACERHWPQLAGPDRYGLGTRYDEALASGRLRYDEDAAGRCVESIRDRDCRLPALSLIAQLEGLEYDPACQVLRADQPGTDCELDLECGEHGYCAYGPVPLLRGGPLRMSATGGRPAYLGYHIPNVQEAPGPPSRCSLPRSPSLPPPLRLLPLTRRG